MNNWISVDDRLPGLDEGGYSERVLATTQSQKGVRSVTIAYCSKHGWHGSGSMSGVIAWQPLPEVYEEAI